MATNSDIRPNPHEKKIGRNSYHDLRAPGWLAAWPVIGMGMLLLGSIIFITLALSVTQTNGPVIQWDTEATRALHRQLNNIPAGLVEYVIFGSFAGKEMVMVIGMILAIYFLYKRFWRELSMVVIGLGGGALLWYFLNQSFDRPRPTGQLPVLPLTDPSFPSGHALAAVRCYGLLAYLLVPRIASRALKWMVSIALLAVIVWIGLSTILAGDHYVIDVLAGYALGIGWAGLAYTLIERYFIEGNVREAKLVPVTAASEGLRTPGLFHYRPFIGLLLVLLGAMVFGGLAYNLVSHGPLLRVDTTVYKNLIAQAKTAPPVVNEILIFGFLVGKQVVLLIVTILCIYFIYKHYWRELAMVVLSSAVGSSVLIMLFIGFSRVFQGGHYLTDVIGGYAFGLAWAGLIFLLLENIFWKRKA